VTREVKVGELDGKIALVTGGSRGLGKQIALELARRGADVAVAARSVNNAPIDGPPGTLEQTVNEIEALGRRAFAVPTDLSNPVDVIAMVEAAADAFGGLDLLMNNAGMGTLGDISETSLADWNAIIAVNLTSQFLAIKTAVPHMRRRGGGAIVNMGSYLAHVIPDPDDDDPVLKACTDASGPGMTPYGVTKAAIERLTQGAAADLGASAIRVNCITPHWTETEGLNSWFPEIDKSGWERPEDWAKVVAYLMSPKAAHVNGRIVVSADKTRIVAGGALS